MIKKLKLNTRGDTIIEILLSIAILSMVLSVSYGLANRSSQATRQAQERSEAQKFAEEQLELLRSYVSPDRPWPADSNNQCFPADNPATPNEDESSKPTEDENECWRGRYKVFIEPVAENTYTVHLDWDNVKGGQDELTLSYKLPVTGDIFDTEHRECSDNENNNPSNDDAPDLVDETDPDCHTDNNPDNLASYDPNIEPEDPPPPPPEFTLTIQKNPNGGGTVTGDGINCGSDCNRTNIVTGTHIQLTPNAAPNYTFSHWTPGDCNDFSITSDRICRAHFTYNPPPPPLARKPLYRCYMFYNWAGNPHIYTNHHYYASEPNTVGCYPGVSSTPATHYEGIMGYVPYSSNPAPRQPVYGGWATGAYDAFYTMNYQEYVGAHNAGWNYTSGVQFYAYPYPCTVPGTVPVHRWWSTYVGNHFYTSNPNENPNNFAAVDGGGTFGYEGIMGCIFSSP